MCSTSYLRLCKSNITSRYIFILTFLEASGTDLNFIIVPSEDILSHCNKETRKSLGTEFNDGLSGDFTTEVKVRVIS